MSISDVLLLEYMCVNMFCTLYSHLPKVHVSFELWTVTITSNVPLQKSTKL